MATPITWRNIQGASLSEASRPLEVAQRSMNASLDNFGDILKRSEAIDANNVVAQKNFNTQDYLNKVAAMGRTPEELAAAIKSGAVDQLRSSYGASIDQAATRGAAESLLANRYQQVKQATEFNHFMTDEATAADRQGFLMSARNGDMGAADRFMSNYLQKSGRNPSELAAFKDTVLRQVTERNQQDERFSMDKLRSQDQHNTSVLGLAATRSQMATNKANADAARENAAASREQRAINNQLSQDRLTLSVNKFNTEQENTAYEKLVKNSPYDSGHIGSKTGMEALYAAMKKRNFSEDAQEDVLQQLSSRFAQGAQLNPKDPSSFEKVPVSVVIQAMDDPGATENWAAGMIPGWSRRGDLIANLVENRMKNDKDLQAGIAKYKEATLNRQTPKTLDYK